MSDRTKASKRFRLRRKTFLVASVSTLAVIGAALTISYWLYSAKRSNVSPLAYLRYPISGGKTFTISSVLSSQLADLRFSDESGMLFAAAIEEANPAEAPLIQQPEIVQPGVRAIAFRDYKMKSSPNSTNDTHSGFVQMTAQRMATNDTHSAFVTVGESLETKAPAAHIWSYLPVSSREGTVYTAMLMKIFALEPMTDVHVDMSEQGEKFAIAAQTETTPKLWIAEARSRGGQISPGEFTHTLTLTSPATAIRFSPDAQTVVTAHEDDTAYLWDASTGTQLRQLNYTVPSPPRSNWEGQATFSVDGSLIAMVDASAIYLWQADTGALLNTFTLTNEAGTNIWGHTRSLAISSDNRWIASDAGHSNKIYFWDTQSGELLRVLRSRHTETIAFSPDDTKLASGSHFTSFTLWELPEQLR